MPMRTIPRAVSTIASLLALFHGSPLQAQDTFTPEHVARTRFVTSVAISPDGKHIAYVLSVPRRPFKDDDGPAWAELHVVGDDGVSRPFVTGEVNVGAVKWTPGGTAITFLAKRGKDKQTSLYSIPLAGGEARRIATHETDIQEYDWSADGKHIAFLATEKEPKEKKELADKGFAQDVFEEEPHPTRIWTVLPDAGEAKPKMLDVAGSVSELHCSPAGGQVAVALAPSPSVDDRYMKRKVHVIDTDTGHVLSKVDNPGKLGAIRWSPDGKNLAFVSAQDLHDPQEGRLMTVAALSNDFKDALPNYEGHVGAIEWQDNETVMFLGDEGVWTTFGEVRFDGMLRKTHVPAGKAVLRSFSLSEDGQSVAMIGESDHHPAEVFLMRHGDKEPRRLTDSNPWLKDLRFAKQEVITYTARDGVKLEGLLLRPLDETPGTKYPLILTVHGGPESHYSNGWITRYSDPGQVGAASGFAVFYPNYRGSTGRGVEFSKLGQGDHAGKEFDDLVDAVDHLVGTGLVDRDKVGVTGGSYGGFATAWCSTYYSNRFAAGVMFVGISDNVAKSGTTDIPNEEALVHAGKRLWEDWEYFVKRSPIYYAEKARTPLLIMHGKDDPRVHPSQSLELYRQLKALNQTPVRLVWYPGEGHGNRKAAARYDYNLRMMQWFDHYLKGPGGEPPPGRLQYGLDAPDEVEDKNAAGSP